MTVSLTGKSGNVADVDADGRLHTSGFAHDDFMFNLAMGNIPGASVVIKFGHGTVVGSTPETIWDGSSLTGITNYTYMTTPSVLYISSDAAGDGQVYEVQGLDGDYNMQTKQVTANGLTFVPLPKTWLRVYRVKNLGSTDNAGNIYVSDDNTDVGGNGIPDTLTNVKAMIIIGNNQTLMSLYTVPTGKVALVTQNVLSVPKGDDVEFTFLTRIPGGVFLVKDHVHVYQTKERREYRPYFLVEEKNDIEIKGKVGAAGGESSAAFDMIILNKN